MRPASRRKLFGLYTASRTSIDPPVSPSPRICTSRSVTTGSANVWLTRVLHAAAPPIRAAEAARRASLRIEFLTLVSGPFVLPTGRARFRRGAALFVHVSYRFRARALPLRDRPPPGEPLGDLLLEAEPARLV